MSRRIPPIIFSLVVAFAAARLPGAPLDSQARATPEQPLPQVSAVADLRPTQPTDIDRARFFNIGSDPLTPGDERYIPFEPPPASGKSISTLMVERVCGSRMVVVGPIQEGRVFTNLQSTFLYTDFIVAVKEWIWPSAGPSTVEFSEPGGDVIIAGRRTRASIGGVVWKLRFGTSYVFPLRRYPGSQVLVSYPPLELRNQVPVATSGWPELDPKRGGALRSVSEILVDLRTAAKGCK